VQVRRKIVIVIIIPLGLIILPISPFLLVALSVLDHFDVSADYSIFILIILIGFVGLILVGFYEKTSYVKWYQANRRHLLP